MKTLKVIYILVCLLLLWSCGQKRDESSAEFSEIMTDPVSEQVLISSSAAVETGKDSTHKFIRTADLKFKVKSVIKSTYDIENIIVGMGGFVAYTNLTSNIDYVQTHAISADSTLETTRFTVTNTLVLRVPVTKLDTTLKVISRNITYLDHRIIQANDVALQVLSNQLTQKRATKYEQRVSNAIDQQGRKLSETTNAEETLLSSQEKADQARISNLSLTDQINYSTINITIYQRQAIQREILPNEKNIDEYKAGLAVKLADAAKTGWDILETFLVFLVELWGIFLFAAVVFVAFKMYRKYIRVKKQ